MELGLEAVRGLEGVNFALAESETLAFSIANGGGRGTATLRAETITALGESSWQLESFDIAARARADVPVSPDSLGLPRAALEYSGSVVLVAEIDRGGTEPDRSQPLPLFFHPADRGWWIYDEAGREAHWNGGALGPAAQDRRRERLTHARAGEYVFVAPPERNPEPERSAGWRPPQDGPPDRDAVEGGAQ